MKKKILYTIAILLLVNISNGQNLVNAYTKNGKIQAQFDNGKIKEVVSMGQNEVIAFSRKNKFIIFERVEQKSNNTAQEGKESYDKLSVRCFNLITNKETILFTTCLDGVGGTKLPYGNSSIFPNENICGFEMPLLSNDEEKLFFQTNGWVTSPAIHYYNLKENNLVFYKAGWLQKIHADGVVVQITSLDINNNQGKTESNGRYVQTCLFDFNGNMIKELSKKEY